MEMRQFKFLNDPHGTDRSLALFSSQNVRWTDTIGHEAPPRRRRDAYRWRRRKKEPPTTTGDKGCRILCMQKILGKEQEANNYCTEYLKGEGEGGGSVYKHGGGERTSNWSKNSVRREAPPTLNLAPGLACVITGSFLCTLVSSAQGNTRNYEPTQERLEKSATVRRKEATHSLRRPNENTLGRRGTKEGECDWLHDRRRIKKRKKEKISLKRTRGEWNKKAIERQTPENPMKRRERVSLAGMGGGEGRLVNSIFPI